MPAKQEHLTNSLKTVHSGQERHLETSTEVSKEKNGKDSAVPQQPCEGHSVRMTLAITAINENEKRAQSANRLHALNLDAIMHLRPVSFRHKASYAEGKPGMNGLKRGFIAQEVEKVLPEVARKRKKIGRRPDRAGFPYPEQ